MDSHIQRILKHYRNESTMPSLSILGSFECQRSKWRIRELFPLPHRAAMAGVTPRTLPHNALFLGLVIVSATWCAEVQKSLKGVKTAAYFPFYKFTYS